MKQGDQEVKKCTACGQMKPLAEGFHKKSASRDGYTCECRSCRNQKNAAWRAANPGYHRQWLEQNGFASGHQPDDKKEAQEKDNPAPYQNHQHQQGNTNSGGFFRLISRGGL